VSEDLPDHAKPSNAPWVFVVVLTVCIAEVLAGTWLLFSGRFAGLNFVATGLLFAAYSLYWLRRFGREKREFESASRSHRVT
tara:strand:+ start:147 stop:392 length:246 start_codon:yes stop_codon:yes gene_type:complete